MTGIAGTVIATPVPTHLPPSVEAVFPDGAKRIVQVNFCKNPLCKNYGVPATRRKYARRAKLSSLLPGTEYTLASATGMRLLTCKLCGEMPPIKSNQGIVEELSRITGYMHPQPESSCPNPDCSNHVTGISAGRAHYYSNGKSDCGSSRYKCRACGATFSVPTSSTLRQRLPHKNKQIFRLLVNKMPFMRICEVAHVTSQTLYDKLDFIHRRCLAFAAEKEKALLDGTQFRSLYVAVDRQDYAVNWTQRKDKRNTVLSAIGSAELVSGYVFGMHLNFDGSLDTETVEADAKATGDYGEDIPMRKYARLWLQPDYAAAMAVTAKRMAKRAKASSVTLGDDIARTYADAEGRDDAESSELPTPDESFPKQGMQVRSEYTMYAHFFFLRELLRGAQKVRFFMDQESGIRAAVLAAFEREVKARTCDAFYVRIAKEMTVSEKRKAITASRAAFKEAQDTNPGLSPRDVEILMMKAEMTRAAKIGKWNDRWLNHPFPNGSEPGKAVCYLTDHGDLEEGHLARLYLRASLHAVDRFFNQVRRKLSLLERPIGTSSKAGRTWYGYSAYRPGNIEKVLDIFRVYYNYCLTGKDRKTPAMRIGTTTRVTDISKILGL